MLIVPDHGDKAYVQEMTHLILGVMGFKEVAVHQVSCPAPFLAGMELMRRKRTLQSLARGCQLLASWISARMSRPCRVWTRAFLWRIRGER